MKYTVERLRKINSVIHDFCKRKLSIEEKFIVLQFLLLIYNLRKVFSVSYVSDNIVAEKLMKKLDGIIEKTPDDLYYNVKNKNTRLIKNIIAQKEYPGNIYGYYCNKDKNWDDPFKDGYIVKFYGTIGNENFKTHLYQFTCSCDKYTHKELKKNAMETVKKYTMVINYYFSKQYTDLKFTYSYEIVRKKTTTFYLNKIKNKDKKYINKNIDKYKKMFPPNSKIFKMINNITDDNKMIIYNFLNWYEQKSWKTKYNNYLSKNIDSSDRIKVFLEKMSQIEDLFITGNGNTRNINKILYS